MACVEINIKAERRRVSPQRPVQKCTLQEMKPRPPDRGFSFTQRYRQATRAGETAAILTSRLPVTLISKLNSVTALWMLSLPGDPRCIAYPSAPLGPRRMSNLRLGFYLVGDAMFKIPAYDPFSIVLMGAGILLAAKLALSF